MQDDLAARVAHELNNPLDGVLRYVNLALRALHENRNEEAGEYLNRSRTGLMRMTSIVREVLGYARAGAGDPAMGEINDAVEATIRSFEAQAADAGVVMTATYRGEAMPKVRSAKFGQICANIIKNAIEAMSEGGMLTVDTGIVGHRAVVRIEDTGSGLPDDPSQVFEPFFTTKQDEGGTGLGLAICRDYVEQIGGTITAGKREGGGAVFTIQIPTGTSPG